MLTRTVAIRRAGDQFNRRAARPNIPRHFGRLNGPRKMPRSRCTAPRSAPAYSCRIFHPVCRTGTGSRYSPSARVDPDLEFQLLAPDQREPPADAVLAGRVRQPHADLRRAREAVPEQRDPVPKNDNDSVVPG